MNGIVAYSRPRGKYGRYVFTIVLNFAVGLKEKADINVVRIDPGTHKQITYSCGYCGKKATIITYTDTITSLNPEKHTVNGTLEFFRYDNVEPTDQIQMGFDDPDLLFYQNTTIIPDVEVVQEITNCHPRRPLFTQNHIPDRLYDITLINWDEYVEKMDRPFRVEEELIQQTMNAEPITIKELLLKHPEQALALKDGQRFIEGELKYLEDGK